MSELVFNVRADYEEVIRLREELDRLREEMLKMDTATESQKKHMAELESQYTEVASQLNGLVEKAAENAAEIGNSYSLGLSKSSEEYKTMIDALRGAEDGVRSFLREKQRSGEIDEDTAKKLRILIYALDGLQNILKAVSSAQAKTEKVTKASTVSTKASKEEILKRQRAIIAEGAAERKAAIEAERAAKAKEREAKLAALNTKTKVAETGATAGLAASESAATGSTLGFAASMRTLNAAMAANPIGIALTIIPLVTQFLSDASFETSGLTGEIKEMNKETKQQLDHLDDLVSIIQESNSSNRKRRDAIDEVNEMCKEYNVTLVDENDTLEQQRIKYERLTVAIRNANAAKIGEKYINKEQEKAEKKNDRSLNRLKLWAKQDFISIPDEVWDNIALNAQNAVEELAGLSDEAYEQKFNEIVNDISESVDANSKAGKLLLKEFNLHIKGYVKALDKHQRDLNTRTAEIKKNTESFQNQMDDNSSIEQIIGSESSSFNDLEAAWDTLLADLSEEKNTENKAATEAKKSAVETRLTQKVIDGTRAELKERKQHLEKEIDDAEEDSDRQKKLEELVKAIDDELDKRTGKETKKKGNTNKENTDKEKEAKERQRSYDRYQQQVTNLIKQVEGNIAKEQISAIENNYEAVSRQFDLEKQMLIDKAEEVGQTMTDLFNGNVDLLNRKTIDAVKLAEKGWEDAGDGIATVFSSQYGINDSTGKAREILVTPILPNGEVLSQKELEDYIYNTLEGAEDMLSADTKGIVIAVDVDEESGEQLHEMQETYYELRGLIDEYDNLKRKNNEKERLDQENKDRREYIKQYGEYIERLDVLNEEYQERLSKAENEWQKQSINKEWQSATSDLKREYESMTELIFQDAGRLTNNELTRAIEETQKAIKKAIDSGDVEALTELFARLREQQSEDFSRNSRSGFAAIGQGFGLRRSAKEKRSTADERENEMRSYEDVLRAESINPLMNEEEVDKLRKKIKLLREEIKRLRGDANIDEDNALKSLTSGFGYAEESLKKIAPMLKSFQSDTNEWGNALYEVGVAFEGIAGAIDLSSKLLDTKLSEAQKKDIIFDSALSVALQLTQEIVKGIQEEVELSKRLELNTTAFANALKLANLSVDESKFKSVFGTDSLALMSEYAIKATESLRETQKAMSELYNVEYNAPTAPGGRASQEQFAQYQVYQKAIEEGQRGLRAMVVKTKDRNGFLNFLGIPDAYATLGDLAPNIFNDDGTLKIAELKTFLDSDLSEVLSAEQRQALQGAVDLNEKYEENIKGLKDALSGVFGSVSNGLADAIIDGLRNGTDVSTDYLKNQMNGVVESLEKQMVNGMIMKYLDQYQEKALAMMEAGGGPEDLLNILNEALDGMDDVVNTAKMSAELFEERAKEKGYDLSSKAQYQQQATYGAFQTMSQDVGTELNGRFSAVQINTENTVAQLQLCNSTLADVLNAQLNSGSFIEDIHKIQADSYLALLAIRDNTEGNYHEVETIRGLLETIRNNTNRL